MAEKEDAFSSANVDSLEEEERQGATIQVRVFKEGTFAMTIMLV